MASPKRKSIGRINEEDLNRKMITATRIHAIEITTRENRKRFDKFESSILNVIQNQTKMLKHNIQNQLRELLDKPE